ncbi:electron transport complex subunit RsxB [Arsenophonus endosymbiont of Bemisia tabaci]|uniref:electron transport complex subunit RsxB n=1 Tax=Arsenophonus endosymbiont of Bemisia tabaci TaxID=536059 RepID=UPI0015F5D461|nr:electron transport complex subunit RsxB [Arsenophonus endosymbiont of Bemisia tabaci]CAA2929627.1 Electron transport complex subunit RsxB [Arsenophonus endosymbiont of Bemisia tabaci Q2]
MSTLLIAIALIAGFGLIFGIILGFAALRFKVKDDPIVEKIDHILPQSQCGQCGYPGCLPYAEAIANNGETINKCGPGGEQAMLKIAELLNVEPQALDKDKLTPERKVAFIDEANCIGCTKCIHACPVDAIIGATRAMHTVVEDLCTGCDLCVAPCPTDCITMLPIKTTIKNWKWHLTTIPVKNITTSSNSTPIVTFASKEQANV